ncbi:regulatory protein RecX [Microbacterium sp. P07]|uniref:regulatory protein RecX n=1 Tax=Microbacterium sp. P07 TaxID=3366952 RepID=UPI0037456E63
MPVNNGGGGDSTRDAADALAPVTPLFGRGTAEARTTLRGGPRTVRFVPEAEPRVEPQRRSDGEGKGSFDRSSRSASAPRKGREGGEVDESVGTVAEPGAIRDQAETLLLKKLRTRQLSVAEARAVVIEVGATVEATDDLVEQFLRLGYLDDQALAEQLVHAAVERKGQGRQVISPLLSKRGIPRDVVDNVLTQLPDDDLERALDFARTKARSLGARDHQTALRRLLGQLARRGYPSSVSMTAARQALDEL